MTPWVTRIMAACVAVFFITGAIPQLFNAMVLVPAAVFYRPWTPITYMFLHGSMGHLFFNMLGLFFFGPRVENRLGGSKFLKLYVISGLGGAALFSVISPMSAVVGASGAVYGVLLAFAMFWPREPIYIWAIIPIEARWLILMMTVLSLYSGVGGAQDGVAHFAHLGGFAGGFLYLRWIDRKNRPRRVERPNSFYKSPGVQAQDIQARWMSIRLGDVHELNRAEIQNLLARVQTGGIKALNDDEVAFLDRMADAQGL